MDESWIGGEEGVGSERLRATAMHQMSNYVIVMLGPEHRLAAVNDASLGLFGGFNPIGLRLVEFLGGADGQGLNDIFDRAFAGEQAAFHRMRYVVSITNGVEKVIFVDFEAVPLRNAAGNIIGTIGTGRDVTEAARRDGAESAATAELTRRYRRATDVIAEVQRALLPSRLPVLPHVEMAASYVIGGVAHAAGGDWFDVLPLADGRVIGVVGDVVGHGVEASAVMAQLRAVTLERLHAGLPLPEVVSALDRFAAVMPAALGATVCILALNPSTEEFEYISAGHPPPLVVDPDGDSRFVAPDASGPLGAPGPRGRGAFTAPLRTEQVLLLYSDGIVERPGVPATRGTVELRRVAEMAIKDSLVPAFSAPAAVDRATVQVLERLTRVTGSDDDITVLALQLSTPSPPFRFEGVVAPGQTSVVRAALRGWLPEERAEVRSLAEIDQILTELLENAVEHGHSGRPARIVVTASLDVRGVLLLSVGDSGQWRERREPTGGRGLGLALVQQLSERLRVEHDDGGTTVEVEYRPWKESHNTSFPFGVRPVEEVVSDVYLEPLETPVLWVSGVIDKAMADQLTAQLGLCTTPGSPSFVIDLDRVTMMSSSSIGVLRKGLQRAATAGVPVSIRCRIGTVAQQVLALAAIPTEETDRK